MTSRDTAGDMVNKIQLTFVAADVLFLATGAITLGFSLIARQNMTKDATNGREAVRHLIYQNFPFEGGFSISTREEKSHIS